MIITRIILKIKCSLLRIPHFQRGNRYRSPPIVSQSFSNGAESSPDCNCQTVLSALLHHFPKQPDASLKTKIEISLSLSHLVNNNHVHLYGNLVHKPRSYQPVPFPNHLFQLIHAVGQDNERSNATERVICFHQPPKRAPGQMACLYTINNNNMTKKQSGH